jgi:hypothetical protein
MSNYIYKLEFYQSNDRPAIIVFEKSNPNEVFGRLTSNLPQANLQDNQIALKTYSENLSWWEGAINPKYFKLTHDSHFQGWICFPIYTLTPLFIKEQFEKTYNRKTDIYEAPQPLWNLVNKYVK